MRRGDPSAWVLPQLLPRSRCCSSKHLLGNKESIYGIPLKGGGLGVQVGLGCIQAQPLYNLGDLGHPLASQNLFPYLFNGSKIPTWQGCCGAQRR